MLHIPITNCDGLIRIEGAGGDAIPYLGYVTVSVSIEGFKSIDAPILIVRNTAYNASVPIIVGTNILSRVQKDHRGNVHPNVQLALQFMDLVNQQLARSNGIVGKVCARESVTLKPGEIRNVMSKLHLDVSLKNHFAMISSVDSPQVFYRVTPGVVITQDGLHKMCHKRKTIYYEQHYC